MFCDFNGNEYTGHSFAELILQIQHVDLDDKNFAANFCV